MKGSPCVPAPDAKWLLALCASLFEKTSGSSDKARIETLNSPTYSGLATSSCAERSQAVSAPLSISAIGAPLLSVSTTMYFTAPMTVSDASRMAPLSSLASVSTGAANMPLWFTRNEQNAPSWFSTRNVTSALRFRSGRSCWCSTSCTVFLPLPLSELTTEHQLSSEVEASHASLVDSVRGVSLRVTSTARPSLWRPSISM